MAKTVYYWTGGREQGQWNPTFIAEKDVDSIVSQIQRQGYVAVRGNTNIGAPEGPPSDSRFRAIGV